MLAGARADMNMLLVSVLHCLYCYQQLSMCGTRTSRIMFHRARASQLTCTVPFDLPH
jgi:hypothetical protein